MGLFALGFIGFGFAIGFGRWSQSLFTKSEVMHFSVNFPAGDAVSAGGTTLSCCDPEELGSPWARDPDFGDIPSGGLLAWGEENRVLFDVGRQGWIKRLVQPNFITISSHWMRNVGTQPFRIRLEMDMCDLETEWDTFERDWDPVTHTSTRYIEPGKLFNMDWFFRITPEQRQRDVLCDGKLSVFDADAGTLLSELPISIINSAAP